MKSITGRATLSALLLGAAMLSACGGDDNGRDPILGFGTGMAALRPSVTEVTPVHGSVEVRLADTVITGTFSEPVRALSGTSGFTVTCAAPCTSPSGTVVLNAAGTIARFVLATDTQLVPATVYTGTIFGAVSVATGLVMEAPYIWTFTTRVQRPRVTAVTPLNRATGVAVNNTVITAAFNEAMAPISGSSSFTVSCAAPCTSPTGTLSRSANNTVATYTLTAGTSLQPSTLYTATVSGATSLSSGLEMAAPFTWQFTTGLNPDTTRPRVTVTVPATTSPGPTPNIPANTIVSAVFSEDMNPATINANSFTLTCAAPCTQPQGTVSYSVGSRTAVFSHPVALAVGQTYTATITTAATDLAGNALAGNQAALPAASNYIWQFTTSTSAPPATVDPIAPSPNNIVVFSTGPANGGTMCPTGAVSATFTVPSGLRMNPLTVNSVTFTVTGPAPGSVAVEAGSVSLDEATGTIATFTPLNSLTSGDTYTAVIRGGTDGVRDMAVPGNAMVEDYTWSFSVLPAGGVCLQPVNLRSAAAYGVFGGTAGMTNTGIQTIINGDIGTTATGTSMVTGWHDNNGDVYTETPANIGTVNGLIYTCTNSTTGPTLAGPNAVSCERATQARLDAQTAYLALAAMPGGPNAGGGNLANLTLTPGVYTAAAGSFMMQGGNLTLDAQGDANAVFVFQMSTTLTVGGPGAAAPQSVILTNNAQAKNVFWQVGSAATINAGGGGTMVGTIISQAGVTFSTAGNTNIVTLNGRALSLGASVTVVDTIINVPAL